MLAVFEEKTLQNSDLALSRQTQLQLLFHIQSKLNSLLSTCRHQTTVRFFNRRKGPKQLFTSVTGILKISLHQVLFRIQHFMGLLKCKSSVISPTSLLSSAQFFSHPNRSSICLQIWKYQQGADICGIGNRKNPLGELQTESSSLCSQSTFAQKHYSLYRAKSLGGALLVNLGFAHKNKTSGHSVHC